MERQQQHVPTSRGVNPGPPRVIDIKKYLANSNTWGVRDDASPPKSVPGDQAYLSDVETNAGGRMYRTESGKISEIHAAAGHKNCDDVLRIRISGQSGMETCTLIPN